MITSLTVGEQLIITNFKILLQERRNQKKDYAIDAEKENTEYVSNELSRY